MMVAKLKPVEGGTPTKRTTAKLRVKPKPLNIVRPDYNLGHMRMLIYGESGVGKTYLAIQAIDIPELCPVLYCDCDRGTMTFASRDVDVQPIESMDDLLNVANYIRYNEGRYKTVIVDCLTSTYLDIVQDRVATGEGRGKKAPDFAPTQGDWMHATFRMRTVIAKFKTAPVNFIAIALSDEYTNDITGITRVRPNLSNKISTELPKDFDIVGYLYMKVYGQEVTRYLQLEPFSRVAAKNRAEHKLPSVIEIATDDRDMLRKIYERIVGGKSLEELGIEEAEGAKGVVQLVKPASSE